MKFEFNFGYSGGQTIIINQDATHDRMHCQVTVQFCDMVWYWSRAFVVNGDFVGDMIGVYPDGQDHLGDRYETNIERGLCLASALEKCGYKLAAQQVRHFAEWIIEYGGFPGAIGE